MASPDLVVFKALLQRLDKEKQTALHKYLSEEEKALLAGIDPGTFDPEKGIASHKERLQRIHPSWYVDLFTAIEHADAAWLVAILSTDLQKQIGKSLSLPQKTISPFGAHYLAEMLYDLITQDEPNLLPIECLPQDPLNALLEKPCADCVEFIDYLGLHDLSPEIQTLINAKVVQKIQTLFSPRQKEYLGVLLRKQEPVRFTKLNLNDWDGNEETLREAIHQRGINRLSKTLYGKHPSLLWHLAHHLDSKRGKMIKAHVKDLKNKEAHAILNRQVETLLNFMNAGQTP